MATISIIGSGVVGFIVGRGFEQLGNEVIFYDIDRQKIKQIGEIYRATTNLKEAVMSTDISFVCVPTPFTTQPDNGYVLSAVKDISTILKKKNGRHTVVIKSTVSPTTTERLVSPLLLHAKKDVGICMNPEFLTENASVWTTDKKYMRDFFTEDRVVIGERISGDGDCIEEIYKPLHKPIFRTDLTTAEMIKYSCNCALAARISYWNEIFLICEAIGVDAKKVAEIARLDERIGVYGTHPGLAFGGKCLPKDLKALISFAGKIVDTPILNAVDSINEEMKRKYGVLE